MWAAIVTVVGGVIIAALGYLFQRDGRRNIRKEIGGLIDLRDKFEPGKQRDQLTEVIEDRTAWLIAVTQVPRWLKGLVWAAIAVIILDAALVSSAVYLNHRSSVARSNYDHQSNLVFDAVPAYAASLKDAIGSGNDAQLVSSSQTFLDHLQSTQKASEHSLAASNTDLDASSALFSAALVITFAYIAASIVGRGYTVVMKRRRDDPPPVPVIRPTRPVDT